MIYSDTDSVVFIVKEGEWEPALGDDLRYLTDKVPFNRITHIVTGGSKTKNYAYKLEKPDPTGIQIICKVRGITLNYKNALSINFDTVRDIVINGDQDEVVTIVDDDKISREQKNAGIIAKSESKDYKIVFDKRVIVDSYNTKPYGY